MAATTARIMYWGFVRYLLNNPYQSIEEMTKKDFIRYVEEYAVANEEDLSVSDTPETCYDDALVTTGTVYTELQLPGITGAGTFTAANTFKKKEDLFATATYPGVQEGKVTHATAVDYDNQILYGL